jgi:hypothetical protein
MTLNCCTSFFTDKWWKQFFIITIALALLLISDFTNSTKFQNFSFICFLIAILIMFFYTFSYLMQQNWRRSIFSATLLVLSIAAIFTYLSFSNNGTQSACRDWSVSKTADSIAAISVADDLRENKNEINKIEMLLNTAVFTTKNILQKNYLITRVYHYEDNSWQFFDDISTNENANIMIVSLKNILNKDSTIKELINMPAENYATRKKWATNGSLIKALKNKIKHQTK